MARQPPHGPRDRTARLLIVDDEPTIRRAYDRILRAEGYAVTVAADGEEALRLLERETFDLAIIDIAMPGISGGVLGMHVHGLCPDMPVIYSSGYGALRADVAATHPGAVYLAKPVERGELLRTIEKLLESP